MEFCVKISNVILCFLGVASASASCPEIEGKYQYTCRITKDAQTRFGKVLDVSGPMTVEQKSCDVYRFINPTSHVTDQFLLNDPEGRIEGNIRKSNSKMIRFKTIEPINGLKSWVVKGTIREKKDGFTLIGRERAQVMGLFGHWHSKFNCHFVREK